MSKDFSPSPLVACSQALATMRTPVMIPRTTTRPDNLCLLPLFPTPNAPKKTPSIYGCQCISPLVIVQFLFFPPFSKRISLFLHIVHILPFIDKGRGNSVASAILPPRPPALIPTRAVKLGLPQLPVDVVVSAAQPLRKLVPAVHLRPLPRHVALEILGAHPARVQLGEEPDKAQQVRLLPLRGHLRV